MSFRTGRRNAALGGVQINKQGRPATCAAANLPAGRQSSVRQPWQPLLRLTGSQPELKFRGITLATIV